MKPKWISFSASGEASSPAGRGRLARANRSPGARRRRLAFLASILDRCVENVPVYRTASLANIKK